MSAAPQIQDLLLPITPDQPCGESLENAPLLASFDRFRLFGQAKALDAAADPGEIWTPKLPESPEWSEICDQALAALAKSKDLRVLAHLGTALLRTAGVPAFCETLTIASAWLETYWSQTYPLMDEDAVVRRSALNCFADPMAVVAAIRRAPLVTSREHGTFSLRDVDIATGQLPPGKDENKASEGQINAAFSSMPLAELTRLQESAVSAIESLHKIDAKMRAAAGSDATPSFDPLAAQLTKLSHAMQAQLALHPDTLRAATTGAAVVASPRVGEVGSAGGAVTSRQDAVRALDAVSDFFRRTEPSSPIPLFLDRAKRLVSKDFLEVLADIAPDAVAQARKAGGLRQGE